MPINNTYVIVNSEILKCSNNRYDLNNNGIPTFRDEVEHIVGLKTEREVDDRDVKR